MKKLAVAIVAVFATAAISVGLATAGSGGTIEARGFPCGLLDGNGNVFTTTDTVLIRYQDRAVLQCVGNGAPAPTLTYFTYENTGLTCGSAYGSTTNWVDKVGRSGNSQLTCQFSLNGNAPDAAASGGAGLG